MSLRHFFLLACVALGLACVTGCGGSPASGSGGTPTQPQVGAALAGNWLIFGPIPTLLPTLGTSYTPGLAMTFDVNGSAVTATATMLTTCNGTSSSTPLGLGYGVPLTGTIASDGTFSVTNSTVLSFPILTVEGTAPSAAGGVWTGSYTLSGTAGNCTPSASGTFTASSIADLTGTYTGSSSGSFGTLSSFSMTQVLQQGAPLVASSAPSTSVKYGLGGSVQVSGFSCFTKGVPSTTRNNELEGSTLALSYTMDDGSNLTFQETVATTQAKQLNLSGIQVSGGQCAGTYSSTLSPLVLQR